MDSNRFNKIKTLNDLKLEKARLRYEVLVAEGRMMENFQSIESLFTLPSILSRIKFGFEVAYNVYEKIRDFSGHFGFWRKKKKRKKEAESYAGA